METDKDIIDLDQIDSQTQNKKKRRNALSNGKAIPVQGGSPFANIMASSPVSFYIDKITLFIILFLANHANTTNENVG